MVRVYVSKKGSTSRGREVFGKRKETALGRKLSKRERNIDTRRKAERDKGKAVGFTRESEKAFKDLAAGKGGRRQKSSARKELKRATFIQPTVKRGSFERYSPKVAAKLNKKLTKIIKQRDRGSITSKQGIYRVNNEFFASKRAAEIYIDSLEGSQKETFQRFTKKEAEELNKAIAAQIAFDNKKKTGFEKRVAQLEGFEQRAAERAERAEEKFRKGGVITNSGISIDLNSDSFAGKAMRDLLAIPERIVFGGLDQAAVGIGKLTLFQEKIFDSRGSRKDALLEMKRAAIKTPLNILKSLDPRDPEGLINLLVLVASVGFLKAKTTPKIKPNTGKIISNIKGKTVGNFKTVTGKTIKITKQSTPIVNGKSTIKFIISDSKGKVIKSFKKTVSVTKKQLVLKPEVRLAISKRVPKALKTASAQTQKFTTSVITKLADLKLYKELARHNTNVRINTIPKNVRLRINKYLASIKEDINNNRVTKTTRRRLQFIKDDLRRYNIKISYKLSALKRRIKTKVKVSKIRGKEIIKISKEKLLKQKNVKQIILGLKDIKLFKSIAVKNTKLRVKTIPKAALKKIKGWIRSVKIDINNKKITQKTMRKLQFIKDDLGRFNIKVTYNLSKLKFKVKIKGRIVKSKISKPFKELTQIGREKLTAINKKHINRIKFFLEDLNLYRQVAKFKTNKRIKTITKSQFNKIKSVINEIKSDIKNNRVTTKTRRRLQFIKDDLARVNIRISFRLSSLKKSIKLKKKIIKGKIVTKVKAKLPFELVEVATRDKIIQANLKKFRLPRQKQIMKNLKIYGQPEISANGKFLFRDKLTGKTRTYNNFIDWQNANVRHGRFLRTVKGKRALRKLSKSKTRKGRIKAEKAERSFARDKALKRKKRIPKVKKKITRKQRKVITKRKPKPREPPRKHKFGQTPFRGLVKLTKGKTGVDIQRRFGATKTLDGKKPKITGQLDKAFLTESGTTTTKVSKGQLQILKRGKRRIKKGREKLKLLEIEETKLRNNFEKVKTDTKTSSKPKIKQRAIILARIKQQIRSKRKQIKAQRNNIRQIQNEIIKQLPDLKPKQQPKQRPGQDQKQRQEQKQRQKQKQKQKQIIDQQLKQKLKRKKKTQKKKIKIIIPIPDLKPKHKIEKLVDKSIKDGKRIFLPDLVARLKGQRATKGERKSLLKKGRIFTGQEARRLVR